jgi:hypothetical protein
VTSHNPVLGSLARSANHAASRRMESFGFVRAAVGRIDVVDMPSCVARFSLLWNQLGVKKAP